MKNVLITGKPGVGKSTLVARLIEIARSKGFKVGGLSTPEIRVSGRRVGFKLVDIATGDEGILARVGIEGPTVSKYGVNLDDLRRVGVGAIKRAIMESDLIVIDEIGKMELFSKEFKQAVLEALDSEKPVVATIGKFLRDPFVKEILSRKDILLFEMTTRNREELLHKISKIVLGGGS